MGAAGRAAGRTGENPLHGAQRELFEEAYVKADDWRVLTDYYASPGGSDEAVRVFLARGVSEAEGERYAESGSEEADMQVDWVPLEELVRGVLAGELGNSGLVVGVLSLAAALAAEGGADALRPATAPGRPARTRPEPYGAPRTAWCDHRLIRSGDVPAALHTGRRSA